MRPPHARAFWPTLAVLFWLCAPASAAVIVTLDGFESGLSNSVGGATLDSGGVGISPTQGTSQTLLTTNTGAVSESTVESALGTSNKPVSSIWKKHLRQPGFSSNGNGSTEGSALQITFTADAGDTLQFDYVFLTNEVSGDPFVNTDFAWFELDRPSGADESGVIAHANQGGLNTFAGPDYDHATGQETFSLAISQGGSYTLTVGVTDVEDSFRGSAMTLDWLRLVKGPEPGTFSTLALGLVGLQIYARRRRRPARR